MIHLPTCLMKSSYGGSAFALLISGIVQSVVHCWLGHRAAGAWDTDMLACDPTYT